LFAGVYVPVTSLPPALQAIGWCLPITHALNGLRAAVAGQSVMQVSSDLFWLSIATMVLLPLSLLVFNHAVKLAKIDGTLAGY
jgi:ABC-type multidrug transport system permease subunit